MIEDITRPDINGVAPKMEGIKTQLVKDLDGIVPYLEISCDDNIMSSVTIRGALTPKTEWANGIFHNAPYFIISITPEEGRRYYTEGQKVTLQLNSKHHKLAKMRKFTGSPNKVIEKIKQYIETIKALHFLAKS